jgi:hypothetical protein
MPPYALAVPSGPAGNAYVRYAPPPNLDLDTDVSKAAKFPTQALASLFLVGRPTTLPLSVVDLATNAGPAVADWLGGNVGALTVEQTYAARTATVTGAGRLNPNLARGLILVVDVTAVTTSTLTPSVQVFDPGTGNYADVLGATALSGTGTFTYVYHPTPGGAGAGVTKAVIAPNAPLPQFRFVFTKGDSSSWTWASAWSFVP